MNGAFFCAEQVEARRHDTGELVYRDSLGAPIATILAADYRGAGASVRPFVGL